MQSKDTLPSGHQNTQESNETIENIAQRFPYSINGYSLGDLVKQYEEKRMRESRQNPKRYGPYEPLQAKIEAYLEHRIGPRIHIEKVIITNIGTIMNELKIEKGNIRKPLDEETTLFLDVNGIEALGLDKEIFDTDKKICFIGPDPTPTLEEKIQDGEKKLRERYIRPGELPQLYNNTSPDQTGVRRISNITALLTRKITNNK